ncbi:MAG: MEDS domain-containing protein [Polyangiales bacterium]
MSAADQSFGSEPYARRLLTHVDPPAHSVQFYESEAFLTDIVATYLAAGLSRGEACIAIATAAHVAAVLERLSSFGVDVDRVRRDGQLSLLDAEDTLASFMDGGRLDSARCRTTVDQMLRSLASGGRGVRAYGELVDLLCRRGDCATALAIERLWNDLAGEHRFSLLCGYSIASFATDADRESFESVCGSHSHVIPAEGYSNVFDSDARMREVSLLQQRARALEAEVADRKRIEEELRLALRLRDDFLSLASHELRTPMTALQLQVQMIARVAEGPGVELIRQRALRARQSASRLAGLIEQLLDVTRIQAERLTLKREELDLVTLVDDVLVSLENELSASECRTTVTGCPSLRGSFDRMRLEQVLTNLVSNAARYGRRQPIEIDLSRDGEHAVIAIRDQGIGIAPCDQARIFERFERAVAVDRFGGLGLGLWISSKIVDAHGGSIGVASELGMGACFTVRLPLGVWP